MQNNFILRLEEELAQLRLENEQLRAEVQRLLQPDVPKVTGLDTQAWKRWTEYRKQLGKRPYKTSTVAAMLAGHPPDVQRAMVQQSIDREWHGLFEIKTPAKPVIPSNTPENFL